ncbi:MAG: VWA domain-containing protein [Myxococcales bacterium]
MFQPPAAEAHAPVVPKEMVFVIDTSGSMLGEPLEAEKRFMRKALKEMGSEDTFMLIDFADSASSFHPSPLPNTFWNVEKAIAYLDALPAAGGTNQLAGVRAALARPADPGRLRTVLFMTDGFIGNEVEILAEVEKTLGGARLFSVGVGSSVNHYLLSRLAEVGRGFYQYVRADQDQTEAFDRFVRRIAKPLVTDVEIDWGGLQVSEVLPRRIADLFDHQPLIVMGKYSQPGRGRVVIHGRTGRTEQRSELEVTLPEREEQHQGLATLWARARIEELEKLQYRGEQPELVQQNHLAGARAPADDPLHQLRRGGAEPGGQSGFEARDGAGGGGLAGRRGDGRREREEAGREARDAEPPALQSTGGDGALESRGALPRGRRRIGRG